jgi:hypothetical protein
MTGLGLQASGLRQKASGISLGPFCFSPASCHSQTGASVSIRTMTKAPRPAAQTATSSSSATTAAAGRSSRTAGLPASPSPTAAEEAGVDATAGLLHDGDGQALPSPLRDRFETSLGTDLGGVRLHTDDTAASEAAGHGARAFAVGNNIAFGAGEYRPDDPFGQHLIAHEVAHTVQQRGGAGAMQTKLAVSSPADAAEHEADRAADAMVTGAPASLGAAPVAVARKPAPAPAYEEAKIAGPNQNKTINWDDPPELYKIAGTGSSLRAMYQKHFKELVAKEPSLVAIGAISMGPIQIGERIQRIADGSEPVIDAWGEQKGASVAERYHQALWRCSQRAIVETLDTEHSNDRYKKGAHDTYCNVYSADMVNAMGGYLPRVWYAEDLTTKFKVDPEKLEKNQKIELNANQIGLWLHKYGPDFGWRPEPDPKKAQIAANSGRVVIIQASKTKATAPGHVNIILAEGAGHNGATSKGDGSFQPLQSQAGDGNFKYSDAVPTDQKANSDSWWAATPATEMKEEKEGNCWIYEGGQHKDTAVGDALGTGGKFGK